MHAIAPLRTLDWHAATPSCAKAIADASWGRFLDELVSTEIAPALHPLPVLDYWRTVRERFANPRIDYRLSQIAEDGSLKVAERHIFRSCRNAAAGRRFARFAHRACWLNQQSGKRVYRVRSTIRPVPLRSAERRAARRHSRGRLNSAHLHRASVMVERAQPAPTASPEPMPETPIIRLSTSNARLPDAQVHFLTGIGDDPMSRACARCGVRRESTAPLALP